MAILAAIITYIGAINPKDIFSGEETHDTTHDISKVNPLYGPGTFFSWLLAVNTYIYEEYYHGRDGRATTVVFRDKPRLVLMVEYGLMAFLEQVGRAWKGDFGHAEAAARYVCDKAYEAFVVIFGIIWRDYLSRRSQARDGLPQFKRNDMRLSSPYSFWPPLVFFLAWLVGRALEHGHDFYALTMRHRDFKLTWKPLIPYNLRYISLPIGVVFGLVTTRGRNLRNRIAECILKMFWMSSMVLHSGVFGYLGTLSSNRAGYWQSGSMGSARILGWVCSSHILERFDGPAESIVGQSQEHRTMEG